MTKKNSSVWFGLTYRQLSTWQPVLQIQWQNSCIFYHASISRTTNVCAVTNHWCDIIIVHVWLGLGAKMTWLTSEKKITVWLITNTFYCRKTWFRLKWLLFHCLLNSVAMVTTIHMWLRLLRSWFKKKSVDCRLET